jgi:hypothetical protein
MSEKCKSTSPSAIQVKNRQKTVSIEEKLDVISRLEKGERIVDVCHNVRLAHSSICTIRDNVDKIKESAKSGTKVSAKRTSYSRSSTMECMEKVLSIWKENQNQCHMPVSKVLFHAKAHSIYEDL